MGEFTNILLSTLIILIGYIGKIFYSKLDYMGKRIEQILLSDVSQAKDIAENSKDIIRNSATIQDHEKRITTLEKTIE